MQWLQGAVCQSTTCVLVMRRVGSHVMVGFAMTIMLCLMMPIIAILVSRTVVIPEPEELRTVRPFSMEIVFGRRPVNLLQQVTPIMAEVVGSAYLLLLAAGDWLPIKMFAVFVALCLTAEYDLLRRICPHNLPLDALTDSASPSGSWPTESPR